MALVFGLPVLAVFSVASVWAAETGHKEFWASSWTASPQPVWGADFALPSNVPERLANQTIRQVARISLGGKRVRLVLSNEYGREPLEIGAAAIALSGGGASIREVSSVPVTFGGEASVTIPPGTPLLSDPVDLPVSPLSLVTVSLYLPRDTGVETFHWDGRQTAWFAPGNQVNMPEISPMGNTSSTTTARLFLSGILVERPAPAQVVAAIGDSITDGNTASLDKNTRWPDLLAERLAPYGVGVINAGISGGRLLSDGMGVSALSRFERDVLSQPGVSTVIVLLGINDIGWPGSIFEPTGAHPSLAMLTSGYEQMIAEAHRRGIRVVGATLPPFEGSLPNIPQVNYYSGAKEALRQELNTWIRTSKAFDAVIDFDMLTRDPQQPGRLYPEFDSGDHLHPGDAGNRAMAMGIDLKALLPLAAPLQP